MTEHRIFNHRKRWLLRNHIPAGEWLSGVAVLGALAVAVGWIALQGENFNAADRVLPYALLAEQPVEDRLYRRPEKRWVAPGAAAGGGSFAESVDMGLFPSSILEGGWAISSRPRRFDADTLYRKINGEAEKFLKQGFQELHYIALKAPRGQAEIAVELFDQGSFAGGLGIFSDHRTDDRKIIREHGALYYTTPVGAIGFSGRYFFRIAGNAEGEAVRRKTGELIRALAALAGDGGQAPLPFRVLTEGMGIDPGRIAYQSRNVFQYEFAREFWFGRPPGTSPGRVFLHRGASPRAAAKLFAAISGEHAQEYKVLRRTKNTVLMRHDFLKTHFYMKRAGALIYGVENQPDAGRIGPLMVKLAGVLSDEG